MSKEEAEAALTEEFQARLEAQTIKYIKDGEIAAEYTFGDFGVRFDFSALVEDALDYSQSITRIIKGGYNITELPAIFYSAERMEDILKELSKKIDIIAENASFSEKDGAIIIAKEKTGSAMDIKAAAEATRRIISGMADGEVELRISEYKPLYTAKDFDFSAKVLGAYETPCYSEENSARRRNIIRAAGKINNSVIYPGEIFSAGRVIAANIPNSGYETATIIANGKPVEDTGGGVCQVVTTLYNAVIRAELEIIQRHNHSVRVSYVDIGFDATVAGDYYDLKFKNNTSRPLLITSNVQNGRLYVKIHGNETRDANRILRFEAKQIELISPEPYREIIDPNIPRGARLVTLESQMGYRVELYKHIYINGREVEQVKINTSVYKPMQGIIAIGAG
jgi:vancomycin resistance protein YoaR